MTRLNLNIHFKTTIIASSWYISLQQNLFHEYFRIFKYVNNHWLEIYKIDLWSRFHVVYKECHCEIMLFLFEKNWKNKKLIMKHLDLSCKINIGYPVLYLQKLFICRKFSVVLKCFMKKIVLRGTSSRNFFFITFHL